MTGIGSRMRYVKTWWALGFAQKVELLWVVILASAAEVVVKSTSLPRITSFLGIALTGDEPRDGAAPRRTALMDQETIAARARMVDRVYRHWPRESSCLRRALVLGYRIRRAHPTLSIGVANEDGEIRAHAWIEVDGAVVGDDSGDWAPLRPHESAG
jgi:hypothetical protein